MGPALVLKTLAERTVKSDVAKMNRSCSSLRGVSTGRYDTLCATESGRGFRDTAQSND